MHSSLFKQIRNSQIKGRFDKNIILRTKFPEEIAIQRQALIVLEKIMLFEKVYKKYIVPDYYREIEFLKKFFSRVVDSNPVEGAFDKLPYVDILQLALGFNLGLRLEEPTSDASAYFKNLMLEINNFKEISSDKFSQASSFLGKIIDIELESECLLNEMKKIDRSLLTKNQKMDLDLGINNFYKWRKVAQEIKKSGYSNLYINEKECFNKLVKRFSVLEQLCKLHSSKLNKEAHNFLSSLKKQIMDLSEHPLFPKIPETSQLKLMREPPTTTGVPNFIKNFDPPLSHSGEGTVRQLTR